MDTKHDLYLLEKFEVGVIQLNAQRQVVALNDYARQVLPVKEKQPFSKLVTAFHPARSQPKVKFLLDEAVGCPMGTASPMTMIINIPEQVLLIKVTRMSDADGKLNGFVLVFYDVTQIVSNSDDQRQFKSTDAEQESASRKNVQLTRIPVVADKKVSFLDAQNVLCIESQAHYTRLLTNSGWVFCNLSIGDLEARLSAAQFMRVHRRFIVNVAAIAELARVGAKTQIMMRNKERTIVPVARGEVAQLKTKLGLQQRDNT